MVASYYANAAKERGLDIITWTLERAGPGLDGFYYDSTAGVVELAQGDRFTLLNVLDEEVGILGIFSDWPATATFYANCMGVSLRGGKEEDMDGEDDGEDEDGDDEDDKEVSVTERESAAGSSGSVATCDTSNFVTLALISVPVVNLMTMMQ